MFILSGVLFFCSQNKASNMMMTNFMKFNIMHVNEKLNYYFSINCHLFNTIIKMKN